MLRNINARTPEARFANAHEERCNRFIPFGKIFKTLFDQVLSGLHESDCI